jgi:hypothetical protein
VALNKMADDWSQLDTKRKRNEMEDPIGGSYRAKMYSFCKFLAPIGPFLVAKRGHFLGTFEY